MRWAAGSRRSPTCRCCSGVGISNAEQAVEASQFGDGVVIGSALVARLLQGGGPDAAHAFVSEVRTALDAD